MPEYPGPYMASMSIHNVRAVQTDGPPARHNSNSIGIWIYSEHGRFELNLFGLSADAADALHAALRDPDFDDLDVPLEPLDEDEMPF